jgi:transposase
MLLCMRSDGSPEVLEYRRRLAVERLLDGYSTAAVAGFLDVDPSSVRRWWAAFRQQGITGLAAQPAPGRPRKLSRTQEKVVLRWLADSPTEHGFPTELWTGARVAELIGRELGIAFHPRSLQRWLRAHGLTPQRPQRVPRERNPQAIAAWLATDWPRIKKRRAARGPA